MPLAEAANAWWALLAPLSVQAAAFAAIVLLLDRLLDRRGWPQLRMALWLLAALRFVLPPTLASPASLGAWVGGPSGAATTGAAASPFDVTALFVAWLAGVIVVSAVTVRRARRARAAVVGRPAPPSIARLAAQSARQLGLRRVPRVVLSDTLPTACVHGLRSPVIALPARAERRDVPSLLLHEMAHVKRRDLWIDAALSALCVVFWFHPAAWLVRGRVAGLRELCCDETAAAALGARAGEYRATLLRAAARMIGEPAPQPAFVGGSSQIVVRLRWLERGPARHPRLRALATLGAALLVGTCALPMAAPLAPRDADVDAARRLITSALDGSARPGCVQLHYAAMRVAAASEPAP